jgi:4-carboxymuconolactone decarboxylase
VDERRRWKRGMSVRRAVLGDDHVDRAARERGTTAFQDLVTRYAWGEIWTRRGLPRRTRSLVTVAALVALNRSEELRLHLRAALRNGVTRREIEEVLLQMAIYCGVPAAHSAFHVAADVFAETGAGPRPARRRRSRR